MGCIYCGRGFHRECVRCSQGKCHPEPEKSTELKQLTSAGVGRPLKSPKDMIDPKSTGRKRAAHLYPIYADKPCEWQLKKNCGGGLHPITGCMEGKQQHRHHGPVKDTTRNEPGNVHRICTTCHNRWHAINNDVYSEDEYDKLPHKPEDATPSEIAQSDGWWKTLGKEHLKNVKPGED